MLINTTLSIKLYIINLLDKGGEILAVEVISEIQKAEQNAKDILQQANKDSKNLISKATLQGNEEYNQIVEKAKKEAQEIINKSIAEGNKEAEDLFKQGEEQCKAIKAPSKDKIDEASKLVIERIVNIHGNS